ncbi:hypothetical protein Tco_1405443 [Tanacetum coccineum]
MYNLGVIKVTREADIGVVEHQKKKKMKEVVSKPAYAQELLNLKKGTRASREAYILNRSQNSDDERTESEREVAKSEKADEETAGDEEFHDEEKVHDDGQIHDDISSVGILQNMPNTEINNIVDVQSIRNSPTIQANFIAYVIVSVIPKQTTPTTTPPTTEAPATPVAKTNPSPTVLQRLSTLEKKVAKLSKVYPF